VGVIYERSQIPPGREQLAPSFYFLHPERTFIMLSIILNLILVTVAAYVIMFIATPALMAWVRLDKKIFFPRMVEMSKTYKDVFTTRYTIYSILVIACIFMRAVSPWKLIVCMFSQSASRTFMLEHYDSVMNKGPEHEDYECLAFQPIKFGFESVKNKMKAGGTVVNHIA
jgi:hypothetical protein